MHILTFDNLISFIENNGFGVFTLFNVTGTDKKGGSHFKTEDQDPLTTEDLVSKLKETMNHFPPGKFKVELTHKLKSPLKVIQHFEWGDSVNVAGSEKGAYNDPFKMEDLIGQRISVSLTQQMQVFKAEMDNQRLTWQLEQQKLDHARELKEAKDAAGNVGAIPVELINGVSDIAKFIAATVISVKFPDQAADIGTLFGVMTAEDLEEEEDDDNEPPNIVNR